MRFNSLKICVLHLWSKAYKFVISIVSQSFLKQMIIGNTFFKRDAVLHARVPGEIKDAFQKLAKAKGRTASEYVLELILQELHREEGRDGGQPAKNSQNTENHDE